MSLEKAIQKLTNAVTRARMRSQPMTSTEPTEKKVTCRTESVGNDPNTGLPLRDPQTGYPMIKCVCRFGKDCIIATDDGPCLLEGFTDTVPFETPCQ